MNEMTPKSADRFLRKARHFTPAEREANAERIQQAEELLARVNRVVLPEGQESLPDRAAARRYLRKAKGDLSQVPEFYRSTAAEIQAEEAEKAAPKPPSDDEVRKAVFEAYYRGKETPTKYAKRAAELGLGSREAIKAELDPDFAKREFVQRRQEQMLSGDAAARAAAMSQLSAMGALDVRGGRRRSRGEQLERRRQARG